MGRGAGRINSQEINQHFMSAKRCCSTHIGPWRSCARCQPQGPGTLSQPHGAAVQPPALWNATILPDLRVAASAALLRRCAANTCSPRASSHASNMIVAYVCNPFARGDGPQMLKLSSRAVMSGVVPPAKHAKKQQSFCSSSCRLASDQLRTSQSCTNPSCPLSSARVRRPR